MSFRLGTHNHGVESVRRIVGNGYCFVDRVISNHTEYGAKNFLTGYPHVIFDVRENRGLDEPAFFMSARFFWDASGKQTCAFFHPQLDIGLHGLKLLTRGHRSNEYLGIKRITDRIVLHMIQKQFFNFSEPSFRHNEPRKCRTRLAGIQKD